MPAATLEQLEDQANALAEAFKDGRLRAVLRARRLPDAGREPLDVTPTQARHVVAREAGHKDWSAAQRSLDIKAMGRREAERALIDAACAGADDRVQAVLGRWPDLGTTSVPSALALGLADVADQLGPATVNASAGPRGWARNSALAEALLEAGADIADGPTLYEGSAMWEAVRHKDIASLEALLARDPPQWHVCHALPHALQYDDVALTRLLLQRGGDPNWTMGRWGFDGNCLHEAVVLGSSPGVLTALLEHGAQPDFTDRDGRTPLALATCLNRDALAAVLREHGARDDAFREVDRWVGACFAGDVGAASGPVAGDRPFLPADHLWLCRAVRLGNDDAVRLLLAGGIDPDAMDDDGERALHLAARMDNGAVTELLVANGADLALLDFAGQTPLDVALAHSDRASVLLANARAPLTPLREADFEAVFEAAADAVVRGDLAALKSLLAAHPDLASWRSARPHRCTLLHYLGANGFESERQETPPNAVAVIDFLIDAGSDPNAVCYTYRGGPAQTTLGLLTSSSHPKAAGLTLAMVSALARGGAELDAVYCLLAAIHQDGSVPDEFDPAAESSGHAAIEAASLGERDILTRLLDAGVDVNAERPDATTALHHAAIDGNAALVDELLSRGADLARRDKVFDGTAAGWAYAGGHTALGKRLAERLSAMDEDQQ